MNGKGNLIFSNPLFPEDSNISDKKNEKKTFEEIFNQALYDKLDTNSLRFKCINVNKYKDDIKNIMKTEYTKEYNKISNLNQKDFIIKFNEIRNIINTKDSDDIDKYITDEDYLLYNIKKEEGKKTDSISEIKYYWRIALVNCLYFTINEKDKIILNYLKDIKFIPDEQNYPNFKLEFIFDKNEYLKQDILTKEYIYKDGDNEEIENTYSTDIEWENDDKNPTKVKKIKHKKKGKKKEIQTITKVVKSFFDIFNKEIRNVKQECKEANFFKDDFFPNNMEYFLGIMKIEEDFEESEDDESN